MLPVVDPLTETHVLRLPSNLYPYQTRFITSRARELVVVSATQIGKTTACAAWELGMAFENPGSTNWWAAPTYKQARIGYRAIRRMARTAGILRKCSDNKLSVELTNGSEFECQSWKYPENLLGPTAHHIVVDEAGLLTHQARSIISSRRSTTLGPIRYIGNPGATGAEFWQICQQAMDPINAGRVEFMKWTWRDRAEALPEWKRAAYAAFIDSEARDLAPIDFSRLYEAEWESPEDAIFASYLPMLLTAQPSTTPHEGHPYIVGWDIGLERDFTVGMPLCLQCFTVTDMLRVRPKSSLRLKQDIKDYCSTWNNAVAAIEINGPGKPIFDEVAEIYPNCQSWFTDASNKRSGVFEIIRRAKNATLSLAPLDPVPSEMRVYESSQSPNTGIWSFSAPSGAHDDTVSALLVAVGAATSGAAAYLHMMAEEVAKVREARKRAEEGTIHD